MRGHLALVGTLVPLVGELDEQLPVVGLLELQRVPRVPAIRVLAKGDQGEIVATSPHPGHRLALQIVHPAVQIDARRELGADVQGRERVGEEGERLVGGRLGDLQLLILGRVGERRRELLPEVLGERVEGIASSRSFYCSKNGFKHMKSGF